MLATPSPPPPPPAYVDVQASYSHESLTNGRKSWDGRALRFTQQSSGRTVYVELSSNSRFGQDDEQVLAGAYVPLSERWMAIAEAGAADPHGILPAESFFGGMQYASGSHWYEGIGARHATYDPASVNSAIATLEHYWRSYRFYYTFTAADLAGEGTDVEHAAEIDRYYGKNPSFIGIGYVSGREVDAAGASLLISSRVRGWNVSGRHWMNRNWGVVYGIGTFAQGNLYTRKGGRLGLDYRF
jgi:YaiO family outer membrane protein